MSKEEESNSSSTILLIIATILTLLVIGAFIFLSYEKKLLSLSLNEIGDSFAGFAGFLAFLWLIVTVILQNIELRLQRKEVSGLKGASEDQAKSLKASLQVQTLTFMRDRQKEVSSVLLEKHQRIGRIMVNFLEKYAQLTYAHEFINNPREGLPWLFGFFLNEDNKDETNLENINADVLKQQFDYEAYLALSDILYLIDGSWKVCKPIYRDALEFGYKNDFESWISQLNISWYRDYYPTLFKFNIELSKVIAKGGIASEIATFGIKLDQNADGTFQKQLEVPFTEK